MGGTLRWLAVSLALGASTVLPAGVSGSDGSVVRLTAVVTNLQGDPVRGLRAADFQVLVDGTPHAIDALEFRTDAAVLPRVFGLLLDEFHVDADSTGSVRDALVPFIVNHVRAGDLGVVVKPLDPLTSIRPTADWTAVRESIASFAGRKGDYTPRTLFEQKYLAHAPAAVITARAQIIASALRALAASLGELRGVRPVIVLVSDGFAPHGAERGTPASLLTALRVANRADVPLYIFAPSTGSPPAAVAARSSAITAIDPARATLRSVSSQTGGDLHVGVAAFPAGLTQMVRDLEAHYVLTYRPAHGDDGRFHSVQVTLKRPELRVRSRAGYVAPLSAALRAAAAPTPTSPTRVLRRSALIQSWSGMIRVADGRARVTFTWEPAAGLGGGSRPDPAMLMMTASTPAGTVLYDGAVAPVRASVRPSATANRAAFEAPSGRVLIDIKVLDAKGVVLDSDARDIEVPNLQAPRATILPPAVLRTGSAREFLAISEDPDAAPVPSRDFRRTERLLLRVPAYEASGAPARVSATLLNRWRQPMRALPAMTGTMRDDVTQFDVPLAPLPPGEYTIRLTAGSASEHVTFRVRG